MAKNARAPKIRLARKLEETKRAHDRLYGALQRVMIENGGRLPDQHDLTHALLRRYGKTGVYEMLGVDFEGSIYNTVYQLLGEYVRSGFTGKLAPIDGRSAAKRQRLLRYDGHEMVYLPWVLYEATRDQDAEDYPQRRDAGIAVFRNLVSFMQARGVPYEKAAAAFGVLWGDVETGKQFEQPVLLSDTLVS